MSKEGDLYELWIGTPNTMGKPDKRWRLGPNKIGSAADCKKVALKMLDDTTARVTKFDQAALPAITLVTEQVRAVADWKIKAGDKRTWQFDHSGVTVRLEIRRIR